MKTLILSSFSILVLILFVPAQTEESTTVPIASSISMDHRALCGQLGLVEGGDYVIQVGTSDGKISPCYTIVNLGDRGWIKVEIKKEKNSLGGIGHKAPHWLNLTQVATILKVDRNTNAEQAAPSNGG